MDHDQKTKRAGQIIDRPILTLAISQTLVWAGLFYVYPAMLLRWEVALGWSRPEITLGVTIAVLMSALSAPFAGRIIDAGRGPVLMGLTTMIGGLGVIALSQITQLWQFYALSVIIGITLAGCLYDACFSLLTHARGGEAKRGIVVITLVAGFAGTISFPAVHFLSEAFGWRGAAAIIGMIVVALVAPMQWRGARGVEAGFVASTTPSETAPRSFLRRPSFWLLGLGFAMLGLVHGSIIHHLMPLLAERGLPLEFAVLIASLIGPMQVAGRLGMVVSQRLLSHHQFMLIAFGAMTLAIVLLLISGDLRGLILIYVVIYGGAWGTVSILRPVIARDILGQENFGAKSGSLALIFLTATASSAYWGALIWGIGGYPLLLGLMIALALLGAAFYLAAQRLAR